MAEVLPLQKQIESVLYAIHLFHFSDVANL